MSSRIEKRQEKTKALLLKQLRKTPIVQIACDKAGISRSTYYRWRQVDSDFADESDQALFEGSLLVNDMAESQLISLIKDKNPTGIIFWLKHHHPQYSPRMEISAVNNQDKISDEELNQLAELLYAPDTFVEGQKLLTKYVIKGVVSEKFAHMTLRTFIAHMRAEDVMARKAETELMTEVMMRKKRSKK